MTRLFYMSLTHLAMTGPGMCVCIVGMSTCNIIVTEAMHYGGVDGSVFHSGRILQGVMYHHIAGMK